MGSGAGRNAAPEGDRIGTSLVKESAASGVKRLVFTAGEVTAVSEEGEVYTLMQRLILAIIPPIMWLTPYHVKTMRPACSILWVSLSTTGIPWRKNRNL